jgi:hypothetical protein
MPVSLTVFRANNGGIFYKFPVISNSGDRILFLYFKVYFADVK